MSAAAQALPGRHLRGRATVCSTRTSAPCSRARERSNTLTSGHRACQGCGEALGARYVLDAAMRATGGPAHRRERDGLPRGLLDAVPRVVLAAAVDPLAVRERARGRERRRRRTAREGPERRPRDRRRAATAARSTSASPASPGCSSANDDVLYVCYDNEAYMNTGVQRSSATPPAARTANTKPVGDRAGQRLRPGQERAADRDGARDPVRRDGDGRRPARPGARRSSARWSSAGRATSTCSCRARSAGAPRRGTRSGSRGSRRRPASSRSSRRRTARSSSVSTIRRRVPVEEYLRLQRRFAHLFGDPPRTDVSRASRRSPTATSAASACSEEASAAVDPGEPKRRSRSRSTSARASPTRPAAGAPSGPSTSHRLPPCNNACPAGENIQQWLYEAEEGGDGYERAWRQIMEDNPFPAVMGRVCYHPCETACNRAQLDEAVGINSVERFLGDEAIEQGWTRRASRRRPRGSACSSSAPGPPGSRRGLPPRPPRPRGHRPRRRRRRPAG